MKNKNDLNILERIQACGSTFTQKQRVLATFIMNNYKEAAFMNSVQLAKLADVSNPSVIRFATLLGYSGYTQMQQDLQTIVQQELSAVDRLSLLTDEHIHNKKTVDELGSVFLCEQENLDKTLHNLDKASVSSAVDLLYHASNVYIAGFQASHFLANYAQFALSKIREHVYQFHEWDRNTYNNLLHIPEQSVAFVIAMPRYPNKTIQFIKEFSKRSIPIILITDSILFPCSNLAQVLFPCSIKYFSYVDPLSSILCLINCLLVEVAKVDENRAKSSLQQYENYISDNNIFYKR